MKTVTKKCQGVSVKSRTRGDGTGKLTISMHIPKPVYDEMYAMILDDLIDGVRAYGQNSLHPEFSIVQDVFDEDDNEKFKAYPNCTLQSGKKGSIENGAEEVAEIDLEIAIMPDEYGNGMYEALAADLKDETVKTTWMSAFTPGLVRKTIQEA